MKPTALLASQRLEARYRVANALRRARAHSLDTAWTLFVTIILITVALVGARRAYSGHAAFLASHAGLLSSAGGALAVLSCGLEGRRAARAQLRAAYAGWRQHLSFAPRGVLRAIFVLAGLRCLPAMVAFAVLDATLHAAQGRAAVPGVATIAVLSAVGLAAALAAIAEASSRATPAASLPARLDPRALEAGSGRVAESFLARTGGRIDRDAGLLRRLAERLRGLHPKHAGAYILSSPSSSGAPVERGWIATSVLTGIVALGLITLRSPVALAAFPISALALARVPPAAGTLWLGRHLPLPFGAVFRSLVLVNVLALSPLWVAAVAAWGIAPSFGGIALASAALAALVLVWKLVCAFAEPYAPFRRTLLETIGLGLLAASISLPAAALLLLALFAWCVQRARASWLARDLEAPA